MQIILFAQEYYDEEQNENYAGKSEECTRIVFQFADCRIQSERQRQNEDGRRHNGPDIVSHLVPCDL